jgi:molecular chaperone GrpE
MIDEANQEEGMQSSTPANAEAASVQETLGEQTIPEGVEGAIAEEGGDATNETDIQGKLAALTAEVQSLQAQLEERNNQYIRIAADFDNFRRRTQREQEDQKWASSRDTIKELLPVVDNFERARSQIKPQTDQETAIHKSYQGVYKQLVDGLKRLGVSPMRAEGQPFDPNLHEAVQIEETNEQPEGTILAELQRGYLLDDRVLRHALVKVAAPSGPVIGSEENQQENSEA